MSKFEIKENIQTLNEFADYRRSIRIGLIQASTRAETQIQIYRFCNNIEMLFHDLSRLRVEERKTPERTQIQVDIENKKKEIEEAIEFLNDNYLMELIIGDY